MNPELLPRFYALQEALAPTWQWDWNIRRLLPGGSEPIDRATAILAELGSSADWRIIGSLVGLLKHPADRVRTSVVDTLDAIIARTPPRSVTQLDLSLRHAFESWHAPEVTPAAPGEARWPAGILALFAMHYNGRVREAAVRELARRSTTPFSLAVLILRANDWVEPVRTPAIAAVRDSLTLQRRAEWMPLLGAIAAITTRSRADNTWILDRIRAIFAQPEGHSLLLEALNSPDRHTARFAFTAVAILPPAERATFIAAGLRNADPVVRLRTAQAIKSSLDTPDRDALIDHMSRDAHMPVRREALYAMLAAPDEPKRRHLLAMLLDPHTSIRHAARVYLRDIPGSPDPREFYIAALADHSSPSLAAAIAGLGDTGSRGDADILAPFATHASPRVGTAAIRAVTRLDPDQRTDWLLSFLANPRPALAAAAARTLRPRAGSLNPDHLRSLVHQSPHPHSRQCALTLLLRRQPFDAAVEAIAAAASPDPAIASHALAHLEGLRKTSVSLGPTESQIQAFSLSISRFGGSLPPHSLDSACHLFGLRPPAAR